MESIQYAVLLLGAVFCAYLAIVAWRILSATIHLACISALTSGIIYLPGAAQVAALELSVGADKYPDLGVRACAEGTRSHPQIRSLLRQSLDDLEIQLP